RSGPSWTPAPRAFTRAGSRRRTSPGRSFPSVRCRPPCATTWTISNAARTACITTAWARTERLCGEPFLRLPWLDPDTPFPPAEDALAEPEGLLAAGADLSVARLRQAYRNGIFPWFGEGDPILWWSPDPRMVLRCSDFSPPHALRKRLRQLARAEEQGQARLHVRVDHDCLAVLRACAAPRKGQDGTWITPAMQRAYAAW